MTTRIQELEELLAKAYSLRTRGNNIRINRQFILAINSNIREWSQELADLHTKVGA